jgi:hypothetical protein
VVEQLQPSCGLLGGAPELGDPARRDVLELLAFPAGPAGAGAAPVGDLAASVGAVAAGPVPGCVSRLT